MSEDGDLGSRTHVGRRWVTNRARVLVPALALSVAFLAAAGVSLVRLAVVVALGGALAGLVIVQASLARPRAEPRAVLVALMASILVVAGVIAVTGGLGSPYLPFLVGPPIVLVAAFGVGRQAAAALGVLAVCLAVLAVLPASIAGPAFAPLAARLLAAWAVATTVGVVALELRLLSRGALTTNRALRSVSEELLGDLAKRRREIEGMSAKVAHEIKNPLTALKSLLALEKANARDDRSRKRFEVMTSEVARMEAIVRDYLTFARPLGVLAVADVDLARLADDVISVLEGRAGDAGIDLRREGKGAVVLGDEKRLKEALLNLGQNALEATPSGGAVSISVDPTADGACVVVRDTGTGISPAVKGRLGTSFVTTREQGTGLGLAIALSIVKQHQGSLEVQNRADGGGAVATMLLPRRPAPQGESHGQDPPR